MNVPDKVTFLRIILAPIFFILFSIGHYTNTWHPVLIIFLWLVFILMELSDLVDGMIARKLQQGSDLGKLLDPFADVISRMTYFFCLVMAGILPFWMYMILLYREFTISFVRINLIIKNYVMGAKLSGKIKAWVYAGGGIFGLGYFSLQKLLTDFKYDANLFVIVQIVFGLCVLIALISLSDYLAFLVKKLKKNE